MNVFLISFVILFLSRSLAHFSSMSPLWIVCPPVVVEPRLLLAPQWVGLPCRLTGWGLAMTIRWAACEGRADPTAQRGCKSSWVHPSDLSSVELVGIALVCSDAGPGADSGASCVGSGRCCVCSAGATWWALQSDLWSVAVLEWEALGRGHTARLAVHSARPETLWRSSWWELRPAATVLGLRLSWRYFPSQHWSQLMPGLGRPDQCKLRRGAGCTWSHFASWMGQTVASPCLFGVWIPLRNFRKIHSRSWGRPLVCKSRWKWLRLAVKAAWGVLEWACP